MGTVARVWFYRRVTFFVPLVVLGVRGKDWLSRR